MEASSIIKTLVYADLFDYPLTGREAWRFLINDTEVESKVIQNTLKILADQKRILRPFDKFTLSEIEGLRAGFRSGQVCADREYFFLKGRKRIVELRIKREEWSKIKMKIAQGTVEKLKIIPTIKMIGVTGALAMANCHEDDDIDFLVVTTNNTLWLTRLLVVFLSPFLGIKRRKRDAKEVKDTICFNLFLDENHLKVGPDSLFLAHEVVQMKPIFDKDGIYERFLQENLWVSKYLPNAIQNSKLPNQSSGKIHPISKYPNILISILNYLAYYFQYLYMKPKMTIERVSLHQAFFHPLDISDGIMRKYFRKLKESKPDYQAF